MVAARNSGPLSALAVWQRLGAADPAATIAIYTVIFRAGDAGRVLPGLDDT
jgi:hypothetical protein